MEITVIRRITTDGYTMHLVCPACTNPVCRVDPQSPVWSLVTSMAEHDQMVHPRDLADDAVGTMYYRQPARGVESLELPDA